MASLEGYASRVGDILHPYGDLDLLLYYGEIAGKLRKFLHGRELATRTWLPKGTVPVVVKRGSWNPPLYIEQLAGAVTPAMIEARKRFPHLEAAKRVLSPEQALVWFYFVPRRYIGFHYATNREGEHREINRIFYDIDIGKGMDAEDAIEAASLLVRAAMEDDQAAGLMRRPPFVSWTGRSFHVMLFLREMQPASFYKEQIEYTGKGRTMTDRLIGRTAKESKVPVAGGHVKRPNHILIDPSQTPSGHLCRVPLGSLHMEDAVTVDGVSIPLTLDMLRRSEVAELRSYTPQRVIDELDELAGRLPE